MCGRTFGSYVTIYNKESRGSGSSVNDSDLSMLANCIDIKDSTKHSIFVAIDVSGIMVKLCQESGYYSHSFRCSLQEGLKVLQKRILDELEGVQVRASSNGLVDTRFDIVLAADTFIYVGALGEIFKNVYNILKDGGLFAFSIELK